MPFICLARTDIPDGVLQILDLSPNTSQANASVDPPGQTKYVNEPQNDVVMTTGAGPITTNAQYDGLAAYLIDNVVAGGTVRAAGTVTSNTGFSAAPQTIVINGVTLTANAAPNPAIGQYLAGGGNATATAASIALAINDPTAVTGAQALGIGVTAESALGVVTVTAIAYGAAGNAITMVATDVDITLSGATLAAAGIAALPAANAVTIAQALINKLSFALVSSTAASPAVISTAPTAHGILTGETVNIVGHSFAPLNGDHIATRINATTFSVGVNNTTGVAGTATGTVSSEFTNRTAVSITTGSVAGDTVLTTATAHGLTVGQNVVIAGHSVAGVNGAQVVGSTPTATTFTVTIANAGPAYGVGGTVASANDPVATVNAVAAATVAGTEILNSAGTLSTAVHSELMQILAGRGYRLPSGSAIQGAAIKAARLGGFVTTIGAGAFAYTKDIKGIRATYAGGSLGSSDGEGVISFLQTPQRLHGISFMVGNAGASGNALDGAGNPIPKYGYQGGSPNTALVAATSRVVTTYNDDGTLY